MQKKLKFVELEILKSFIKACDKLNLTYYVIGGTLLGAVRHGGFIPWDDDIDVGMPRKDYEIFLKKGQEFLPENYFLQNIYTENNFLLNYSKIRDSQTTFIETASKNLKINHGVFIDIFPLDFYTDNTNYQTQFKKLDKKLNLRITADFYIPNRRKIVSTYQLMLKMIYPSVKKALLEREDLLKSITSGNLIANHCGAWGDKEIMPVEWYGDGIDLDFEGIVVKGPKEYDKWLTHVYGDYMKLPPEEKRVTHHYTDVIDLEKSYLNYIEE